MIDMEDTFLSKLLTCQEFFFLRSTVSYYHQKQNQQHSFSPLTLKKSLILIIPFSKSFTCNLTPSGLRRIENKDVVVMGSTEELNQDLISRLPNDILAFIISKLRIDEAMRCDVLSKRWVGLWKQTSHIEFDAKHMIKPLTKLLHSRQPHKVLNLDNIDPSMYKGVCRYGNLVHQLLNLHSGDISSCRFMHFRKSLVFDEVESWIEFLVDKKVGFKDLSLECEPDFGQLRGKLVSRDDICNPCFIGGLFELLGSLELINYTIDGWYAFEECNKLTKLKLQRIYMDDITLSGIMENCRVLENFSLLESIGFERLIIMKSKLKVLHLQALCVNEVEISGQNLDVLLLDSIICPTMNEPPSYNIFRNVLTLLIDLDLNHIRQATDLPSILRSCTSLKSLEISLPVFMPNNAAGTSSSNDGAPSNPISMFWETQELCDCIHKKLKFVYIRGFRGKEPEVEFAKYLITKATMMERITIVCKDTKEVAENLLSLPRASSNLTINLKSNANNAVNEFVKHQKRPKMVNNSSFLY